MPVVVRIAVLNLDCDGFAIGKAGRSEVEIPAELFPQMAAEVDPTGKRGKLRDRQAVAAGLEALMRAWIDVYGRNDKIVQYKWYKDLPLVRRFAEVFSRSLKV